MRILVTGGSGFVGRNIVDHLSKEHDVLAPLHKELDLLDDGAVEAFFKQQDVDIVIHTAVKPGHRNAKDQTNQLYDNTRMFFNIVSNSGRFRKLIHLSSGAVYDMRYYLPKMKEEYFGAHVPLDEYGFSKYIAAKYAENADNIVDLRVFGIFGKYEEYAIRFISNAICKALLDMPITIKQNRRFDYLYIKDLMPVVEYFLEKNGRYKFYNVTPDESIELRALAEKVRNVSGKDLPIKIAQPGMGVEYSGNNQRLHDEIQKLRFTNIDDAIKELYGWYSKNIHLVNKEILLIDK